MTVSQRRGFFALAALLLFLLISGAACVDIPLDEPPPYPTLDRDYSYTPEPEKQPPWENPEDYPYVTITAPADGAFIGAGDVAVSGTYEGPKLASLKVNGQTVTVSGGRFETTLTVAENDRQLKVMATATTTGGLVSSDRVTAFVGQSAAADAAVEYALLLNLENRGLANVSALLSAVLDGRDVTDLLNDLVNPELKETYADTVVINEAVIDGVDIYLQAAEDGLQLNLTASLTVNLTLFGLYTLEVKLNGVTADLLVNLTVDNDQLVFEVIDGTFAIADVQLNGPLIPGFIGDLVSLLSGALWDLFLKNLLVDELNTLLTDLTINLDLGTATLGLIPGATLVSAHNFVIAMDTTTTLNDGWTSQLEQEGFLVTASTPPTFTETTPNTGKPYGVAVGLNDDMVNQMLYLLAASGGLNLSVTDDFLTAEALSILFFSFENFDADTPIVIQFQPSVAPYLAGNKDGVMNLVFPAYTGSIMVDRGAEGLWEALSFAVDLTAPTSLLASDGNTIGLNIGALSIGIEVVHNPVGQANIDQIDSLLAELFESVLPELLGSLAGAGIEIPELLDLQISIPEVGSFGPNSDYLGLFLDVVY